MSSLESLRNQVASLRAKVGRPDDPKSWHFIIEDGMDIPMEIQAQIGRRDHVVTRIVPQGLLALEGGSIGYVITQNGKVTVLYDE